MSKKKKITDAKKEKFSGQQEEFRLHHETKKSVWAIIFAGIAAILLLARFKNAGPAGSFFYEIFETLFGLGYYLLPLIFLMMAGAFLISERRRIYAITFIGAALFIFSGLGLIDILFPEKGGVWHGCRFVGKLFGYAGSLVIVAAMIVISILIVFNAPIKIKRN